MNKIPTAEEFLAEYEQEYFAGDVFGEFAYKSDVAKIALIEFAKLHVEQALKTAAEDAALTDFSFEFMQEGASVAIDKDSILDAYPPENIK